MWPFRQVPSAPVGQSLCSSQNKTTFCTLQKSLTFSIRPCLRLSFIRIVLLTWTVFEAHTLDKASINSFCFYNCRRCCIYDRWFKCMYRGLHREKVPSRSHECPGANIHKLEILVLQLLCSYKNYVAFFGHLKEKSKKKHLTLYSLLFSSCLLQCAIYSRYTKTILSPTSPPIRRRVVPKTIFIICPLFYFNENFPWTPVNPTLHIHNTAKQ